MQETPGKITGIGSFRLDYTRNWLMNLPPCGRTGEAEARAWWRRVPCLCRRRDLTWPASVPWPVSC